MYREELSFLRSYPATDGGQGGTRAGPCVLLGPPGVGKSRLGQELARRLDCRCWDSDQAVADLLGAQDACSACREQGEAHFRTIEEEIICSRTPLREIWSLGGGCTESARVRSFLQPLQPILLWPKQGLRACLLQRGTLPAWATDLEHALARIEKRAQGLRELSICELEVEDERWDDVVDLCYTWVRTRWEKEQDGQ